MRSILLQNANFKITQEKLVDEIRKLNKLVVDYSVKRVVTNVQQFQGYIKDIEKMPSPMDRPSYSDWGSHLRSYDMSPHTFIQR